MNSPVRAYFIGIPKSEHGGMVPALLTGPVQPAATPTSASY